MNKEDRRVKRTTRALWDALAELLTEKELHNITVRELTDKADIHRATFYTHYKDVYDLYEQIENNVMEELAAIFVGDPTHSYKELFEKLIQYVYNNPRLMRMFLDKSRNRSIHERIISLLEQKYIDIWDYETNHLERDEEWMFMATYHLQGCISMLEYWAKGNFTYPKDRLIKLIVDIDANFDRILPD
ncbi:TetR/AcrR family transcriptional regulator ['Paenibacillus yunnanensis' Narsing Rao et al. 2020]|uniref:TetR/AcrR family transcriptional regulator n=1 Tax=Paenibacillus tengchongensis TaxID=2608684 RepID=UPI00124EF068|nr:TetR/AcrR family transcriptional regulator [Paenibacillus tengchongensis]